MKDITAIILAGSRAGERDEIAAAHNVRLKAFVLLSGTPMIARVIAALRGCDAIDDIVVSLPDYDEKTDSPCLDDCRIAGTDMSPARSLLKALEQVRGDSAILVTTADHALLTPEMITALLDGFDSAHYDGAAAMVPLDLLAEKYPQASRTRLYFREGAYKSCNLFLFRDAYTAKQVAAFWITAEAFRKKPWRLALALGPVTLLRYLARRLTLVRAFARLSVLCKAQLQPVLLDIPEAAIDADSLADLALIKQIIEKQG